MIVCPECGAVPTQSALEQVSSFAPSGVVCGCGFLRAWPIHRLFVLGDVIRCDLRTDTVLHVTGTPSAHPPLDPRFALGTPGAVMLYGVVLDVGREWAVRKVLGS